MNIPARAAPPSSAQVPGIGPYSVIHPTASVADTVRVESHVVVGECVNIGRDSVIGSGTHLGDQVTIGNAVRIGSNCTVLAGVAVAAKAEVRPGAVVTRSVPPAAIVEGNPATIVGYVDTLVTPVGALPSQARPATPVVEATGVKGVTVHNFPVVLDLRGNLTAGEFDSSIPFRPLRYFMVFDVPSREIRGEHAHRVCHQFLICVRGSCAVVADDGEHRIEIALDSAHRGLYLPPMTWGIQYKYSPDALLLVFASHHYDPADYIRDHAAFLDAVRDRRDDSVGARST